MPSAARFASQKARSARYAIVFFSESFQNLGNMIIGRVGRRDRRVYLPLTFNTNRTSLRKVEPLEGRSMDTTDTSGCLGQGVAWHHPQRKITICILIHTTCSCRLLAHSCPATLLPSSKDLPSFLPLNTSLPLLSVLCCLLRCLPVANLSSTADARSLLRRLP